MDVVGKLRLGVLRQGLDDEILVNNCGTIDLCDVGPNLVVYPDNVILSGVTVKDVPAVIAYLAGGDVPEQLVLNAETPAEMNRRDLYAEAVARDEPLPSADFAAIVAAHGLDEAWIAEQLRRGFIAKKPHPDDASETITVTKKARARYSV
jgi:(2Fe-2S) ferredoxin